MLKLADLKPGDRLTAHKGLSCLEAGKVVEVFEADREYGGGLAVECKAFGGTLHLLAPGATRDGVVTRFSRAPTPVPKKGR